MKRLLSLGLAVVLLLSMGCAGQNSAAPPSSAAETPASDSAPPSGSEAGSRSAPQDSSSEAPASSAAGASKPDALPVSAEKGPLAGGQALARMTEEALAEEARFMSSDPATRDWSPAYDSFYDAYGTLASYTLTGGLDPSLVFRGKLAYTLWTLSPSVIAGDIYDNISEGAPPEQIVDKFKQKTPNLIGVLLSDAQTGDYYGEGRVWLDSSPEANGKKFAEVLWATPFEVGDYCRRTSMTVTSGVEEQLLTQGFAYKTTTAFALEINGYAYGVCFIDRTYGKIAFWLGGALAPGSLRNMQVGVVYPFELVAKDIHERIDEIGPEPEPVPVPEQLPPGVVNPSTAKPVVYLYPERPTEISVTLGYPEEELTYTYPAYENGWRVRAEPDGTLTNLRDGSTHYYLFWEGDKKVDWDLSEGFVIKGSDTEAFLREKLAFLGLTPREYNDFITYWAPEMSQNPYNLISFSTVQYEALAPLTISPAPDSILRVHMVYKGLRQPVKVLPQILVPWRRTGFAAVEWGGSRA